MILDKERAKQKAIDEVISREGGYVNHPDDKGGETIYGITIAVARKYGYTGSMEDMPIEVAREIYEALYWDKLWLDKIGDYSPELAVYLFDFGVNSGTKRAAEHFQRLLNVLNNKENHYSDIVADGYIGNKTMEALKGLHKRRGNHGVYVLAEALNALRIAFCVELSERKESQESFTFGWLTRIVEL